MMMEEDKLQMLRNLQVKCEEAKVIFLLPRSVVRYILHHNLNGIDVSMDLVFVKESRQKAQKGEASKNRHGVCRKGISPSEGRMHLKQLQYRQLFTCPRAC